MNVLRSTLFMLWAIVLTLVLAPPIIVAAILLPNKGPAYAMVAVWRAIFTFGVRWLLGIRTVVRGLDNMPGEAAVILAKHQSAWETVALQDVIPPGRNAVFVMKKELLRLPVFGWALGSMPMISIDRTAGKDALDQVVEQGSDRLRRGYYVIVFPEGTRVPPGQKKRYKIGGAHLAVGAGCKAVPVAHNAGELWPRNAYVKRPGTITISIGPAIDTRGLTDHEVNQRAEEWIEAEMRRLSPHRYRDAKAA